jgi:hypothetical protein
MSIAETPKTNEIKLLLLDLSIKRANHQLNSSTCSVVAHVSPAFKHHRSNDFSSLFIKKLQSLIVITLPLFFLREERLSPKLLEFIFRSLMEDFYDDERPGKEDSE